jgi:hypothetical protein
MLMTKLSHSRGDGICLLLETQSCSPVSTKGKKKTPNPFLTGIYSPPFPSPFACSSLWLRHQTHPKPCPPGFHLSTSTPFSSQPLRLLLKITKARKLEKQIHRGIIMRGTKDICKESGRKTKTKSKGYVIHEQVNRERPNHYPIGPQLAQSPSWVIKEQKVRR